MRLVFTKKEVAAVERLCGQKVDVNEEELQRFHRVLKVQHNLQGDLEVDILEVLTLKFIDTCKTVGVLVQVFMTAAMPAIKQLETFVKELYDDSMDVEKKAS